MRRAFLVLIVFSLVAVACSDSKPAATTAAGGAGTITPVTAGQLTVATNLPAPGFWNGDDPDHLTGGFEYGVAQEVAKRAGLAKVKVVNVSFDALVAGQASGFDFALSQVTITTDRAKVVDFSTPYYSSDQGIMVNKGTKVADAAAAKNLQWGVQQSTTAQDFLANTLKPAKEARVYGETTQAFTALQAKQIDAVLLDTSIVLAQANQKDSPFEVVGQFKTGESYGAILPKGSNNKAGLDKTLAAMDADGTLKKLREQYLTPEFGKDPGSIPYITV